MIDLDARRDVFDERYMFNSYTAGMELCDYNRPFSVSLEATIEPQYAPTSLQFLRDYQPETPGMKKAKSFWLKAAKYERNPEAREQIRSQYPEEVAALRRIIRLKHISIDYERILGDGYFRTPRDPNPYVIPENFVNLEDYFLFEPEESVHVVMQNALTYFIGTYKNNGQPWTLNREDLRLIQRDHGDKVDRLKQLLWQRHLLRVEELSEVRNNIVHTEPQRDTKALTIVITTISFIAASVFAGTAFFMSQPILFAPSAVFLIATIATPIIHHLRKISNEPL